MSVFVARVDSVVPHPESDRLDLVSIAGRTNVANRPAPETPRYKVGDYAIVLTENLILPEDLIRQLDMWDEAKNKGGLAGSKGNRTKARRVGGVMSEVALCAVQWDPEAGKLVIPLYKCKISIKIDRPVEEFDVGPLLNIVEYVPQN